jgi:hypothetical protein
MESLLTGLVSDTAPVDETDDPESGLASERTDLA